MSDAHKNFAYSLVATAPVPAASGTSLVVTATEGANFPATPFNAVVWPAGAQPTNANAEVLRVSNIAGDTLTIARTQEGSSARTIVVGDQIAAAITKKTLNDVEGEIAPATDQVVHTGFAQYQVDEYEIASGKYLEIEAGAALEIG